MKKLVVNVNEVMYKWLMFLNVFYKCLMKCNNVVCNFCSKEGKS